jgi:hypothetical protein
MPPGRALACHHPPSPGAESGLVDNWRGVGLLGQHSAANLAEDAHRYQASVRHWPSVNYGTGIVRGQPMDFLGYYDLESYLLNTVRLRFHEHGRLSAFDFFSIVIWKANRVKSLIARRLLAKGFENLDSATSELTAGLVRQLDAKERLRYLCADWGLRLPMASAILSILYPDDFTVYDYRLCELFGEFHGLATRSKFEDMWHGYQAFRSRVIKETPTGLSLRDRDRYLWGKSASQQLMADVKQVFGVDAAIPKETRDVEVSL